MPGHSAVGGMVGAREMKRSYLWWEMLGWEGEWENVSMGKWEKVGDEEIRTMRGR